MSGLCVRVGRVGVAIADCCARSMFSRALKNTVLNSNGISSGNGSVVLVGDCASVSATLSDVSDDFVDFNSIFGSGIVISGFLLRTINVVVDMYNGTAANINKQNTKPPNPLSRIL